MTSKEQTKVSNKNKMRACAGKTKTKVILVSLGKEKIVFMKQAVILLLKNKAISR